MDNGSGVAAARYSGEVLSAFRRGRDFEYGQDTFDSSLGDIAAAMAVVLR
jgi:hypothetical protein